ncbi:MAG: hypothetical protein ACYDBH_25000, partial [Acidobacteriaceae bacterium]
EDRARADQEGADQAWVLVAEREKEGSYSVMLFKGHYTSRRDQGLPPRGREGKEIHDGELLGPRRENLKTYGRWAVAEFTDVFEMETDFAKKVAAEFDCMIDAQTG